ncbi:GAF domain-containing protein [Haloglomus litoreum]|uniref:GAF domain-containing protein n=1 Tax=Haloglomus litoreum TaxID=3034026 RepID=UPI0023E794EE|nr:GAF domain-containing protein [Haloglomus sp. DT116]
MTGTVLYVDPDEEARGATTPALEDAGLAVTACADLDTAVDALDDATDCVVTEFELPDGTGLDLLTAVRERTPDAGFVLFTDADPDDIGTSALAGAVTEYVPKGSPNAHELLADLLRHTVAFRSQTAYPLPDDESERVAALDAYRPVLEAVQPAFDRLTALASDLLDVPMATIGVVDDREQEFLACYGVDLDIVPREQTVCTYALLEPGVTTIPDLAEDPRFADNEALDTYGLRAYASANLITPEGRVVGTFCAYDSVPRDWTDDEREHLRLLAAEAMETLDLRRRLHEHGGQQAAERQRNAVPAGAPSDQSERPPDDWEGGRR